MTKFDQGKTIAFSLGLAVEIMVLFMHWEYINTMPLSLHPEQWVTWKVALFWAIHEQRERLTEPQRNMLHNARIDLDDVNSVSRNWR